MMKDPLALPDGHAAPAESRRGFLKKAAAAALTAAAGSALPAMAADKGQAFSLQSQLKGDFTLTAVGDLIITHPVLADMQRTAPEILALLKNADVTFGNFEETAIDLNVFKGYPEALSGGGWLLTMPEVPASLKAMGFNMVSHANNHGTDWGTQGLLETDRHLDEAGLVHAGSGPSLTAARAPAYYDSPRGRIALVAVTSHFTDMEPAQDGAGKVGPRPGVNTLHDDLIVHVPEEDFNELVKLRDKQVKGSYVPDSDPGTVTLFGTKYKKADAGQTTVTPFYAMNANDEKEILRNVRQGKEVSDFAIVSIHTHEPGNYSQKPPDFQPGFAHDAIDSGADAFLAHGPHQVRGIEIYKGKPIFYSLGNFFFMDNSQEVTSPAEYVSAKTDPQDMTPAEFMEMRRQKSFKSQLWFESVVTVSRFKDGMLDEIRLHPIELGWEGANGRRGIPKIASPEAAQRILKRLQTLSQPFGTVIAIEDNIGVIRISAAKG
jgi:poly-gamma-glutamate synthesis protein (capsule biosynthesis protein)